MKSSLDEVVTNDSLHPRIPARVSQCSGPIDQSLTCAISAALQKLSNSSGYMKVGGQPRLIIQVPVTCELNITDRIRQTSDVQAGDDKS